MSDLSRRDLIRQMLALSAAPFVVGCGLDRLAGPRFFSADGTDLPVTLIGAGDQHAACLCNAHKVGKLVKAQLDADPTAIAFALGDLVPNGLASEYLKYYDTAWGSFKNRTLFMMGNHDKKADPFGNAYYDYVAGQQSGERGKGYYALTLGAWRCYFLNSEMVRPEQTQFLAADLPQWSSSHHIMAMWHTPMYASLCMMQPTKPMTFPVKLGVLPWWQVLEQYGCEFVVSGHCHRWERFLPLLSDGSVSDRGIRQFITGNGGVAPMPPFSQDRRCESQVTARGWSKFSLYPDRYEWTFTDVSGVLRDSGVQPCRALAGAGVVA